MHEYTGMEKGSLIQISLKGLMPTANGCAIFLGNEQKTFVMHIDPNMGLAISLHLQNTQKTRPLTHDLIATIFMGLGIHLKHIFINDIDNATFFARIMLSMDNELGTKIVEIDSRPSDALVLALQAQKPIYVASKVFNVVEDVSDILANILNKQKSEEEDENFSEESL